MQTRNRYSWSEASSVATSGDSDCSSTLGMGAPDIDLSEIISDSRSAGYSSLLHDMSPRLDQSQVYSYIKPCDTLFYINDYHPQLYTSVYFQNSTSSAAAAREFHNGCPDSLKIVQQQILSQDDHYSLLPTLVVTIS